MKVGAVLSYGVIAVQFVVTVLYTPIMLRLLGQSEYGLYSLVASIVSYLGLLSFGFSGAYMRFYARLRVADDNVGIRRLNGVFLSLFGAMGAIAAAGGAVLSQNVTALLGDEFTLAELDTARILFVILSVDLAVTFPASVFTAYVIAHERFFFYKSLQILKAIANPLVALPILLLGYQSIGMAIGAVSVDVVLTAFLVIFAAVRLKMRFAFGGLDLGLLREVSVFSSFLFINMVVDQVNWNIDKFIIGRIDGPVPVAVYGVAATLNTAYLMFSTAISSLFIPRVNAMVAGSSPVSVLSELFARVGRLQFLVLGLVSSGFVLFGHSFIEMWAGQSYGDAYYMALFLMIPVTFPLVQNLGIEIQKAKNLHQFRSLVYLSVAVGNVILSIVLTRAFGGVGAAAATGVALLIGNVVLMNWHYWVRVGLDIGRFWRQICRLFLGMIPAFAIGAVISIGMDLATVGSLMLAVATYGGLYAACVWWLSMNDYERRLIGGPAMRLVGRFRKV